MKAPRDLVAKIWVTNRGKKMWLQCQDRFDTVGAFDETYGRLERLSRKALGSDAPFLQDVGGFFSDHLTGTLMLYRQGGKAIFRVYGDGLDRVFELDPATEIKVSGPNTKRELRIFRDGAVIFQTTYVLPEVYRSLNDFTPFVEDEDFDFGLYVSNISKNPVRKDLLLGQLKPVQKR